MAKVIDKSDDTWVELTSDPGIFTLLVEDFGVQNVQVKDVINVESEFIERNCTVYGFIFLYEVGEGGQRGRKPKSMSGTMVKDQNVANGMFFAKQKVTNACASYALLSILMNCDQDIGLGDVLTDLKFKTTGMSPEDKGKAVGECQSLAIAHNRHATDYVQEVLKNGTLNRSTEPVKAKRAKKEQLETEATYHFISYVPINGHLYELDGLKPAPIDHGEIPDGVSWKMHFQSIIKERFDLARKQGIFDFNLMALVPSTKYRYERCLEMLNKNKSMLLDGLRKLLKDFNPEKFKKKSKLDEFSLIDAAINLSELGDLDHRLTAITSSGQEITFEKGYSVGVSDRNAMKYPISELEIVNVTKDCGIEEIEEILPMERKAISSGPTVFELLVLGLDLEEQEILDDFELKSVKKMSRSPESTKRGLLVEFAKNGLEGRSSLFEPLGLVTYIQQLEVKISTIKQHLDEEAKIRLNWEADFKESMVDYDAKIRGIVLDLEESAKEEALAKLERAKKRGTAAGRKRKQ